MTLNDIEKVRVLVADTDITLPILPDITYEYFLEKNSGSVSRASMDAARSILFNLSMRGDEQVDIFSIKGSKAAESYKQALTLYLKDPYSNPVLQNCQGWVGGVSVSQMQTNDDNTDNNIVKRPSVSYTGIPTGFFTI